MPLCLPHSLYSDLKFCRSYLNSAKADYGVWAVRMILILVCCFTHLAKLFPFCKETDSPDFLKLRGPNAEDTYQSHFSLENSQREVKQAWAKPSRRGRGQGAVNRTFPSCSEAKCKTFHMKISFVCM